jgi:hypothetical protein
MLDAIATVLERIWGWVQSGWNWVSRMVGTLINDIRDALMPLAEAAVSYTGAVLPASLRPPSKSPGRERRHAPGQVAAPPPASASPPPTATEAAKPAPASMAESPPTNEMAKPAPAAPVERPQAGDKSDETALARMLASDDSPREVAFIRGWIAVQRQRARKVSMFELLTRGLGYGPRNRKTQGQPNVYASTIEEPSDMDRAVAHSLLTGTVSPSGVIRMHKPGQLIERGKEWSDAQILRKQAELKEGVYGSIQGTQWLLLSPDAPATVARKGQSAKEVLDGVPSVPVMDSAGR